MRIWAGFGPAKGAVLGEKSVRIVAINSSHRGDKGFTRLFIDRLVEGATAAGADCEVITLAKLKINRCLSCYRHINPAISSKPFVALVVCSNLENETWKNVTSYFRTYAKFMEAREVGVLVRNASALFDYANNPTLGKDFPKIFEVCRAYEQAGRELATLGYIRHSTQRRANQEIVPVPFFGVLKHFRPIKQKVIEYLRSESEQVADIETHLSNDSAA
jgi:hypothetical protein